MKQPLVISLLLINLMSCKTQDSKTINTIRIPGEFEPQEAIWLGYKTLENHSDPNDSITLEMIRAVYPYVDLKLMIENDTIVGDVLDELYQEGIDTSNIELVFQSPADVWYRDPGPIFAVEKNETLKVIDFKYTGYANVPPDSIKDWAKSHEAIDRDIAKRLGIETINSIVALEGGAFETDGNGTLIQVENITLKRNPHLTKKEIEEDFRGCCGIEKVIWLPAGVADDPLNFERIVDNYFGFGTGGHTDEFVRFANDSTILLAWVTKEEKTAIQSTNSTTKY
ncbi:MAG: agmatine deiminase family protein [Bacteroidota bacterium]